jgi:histidinol phosphatase-like enzyme (inositol monophosphatase family)
MATMDRDALSDALEVAVEAVEAAGRITLEHWRRAELAVEAKADGSPVTVADRGAEARIREMLRASAFGGLDIVGEELGSEGQGSRHYWLIDPIDGTKSFSRGLPLYGVMLALVDRDANRALAGVVGLPALAETYAAARGLGATCNGAAIRASVATDLASAVVSAPDAHQFRGSGLEPGYLALRGQVRWLRGYGDCFAHAMAARGALDAVLDPSLSPWDAMASQAIVEEAGGAFLTRPSPKGGGRLDVLLGSAGLVDGIARLVGF